MDVLDWREPANDNTRKCVTCGADFVPNKHNQKYCGLDCLHRRPRRNRERRNNSHTTGPERRCENCNAVFRRRSDSHNAARFCSRKCGFEARANMSLQKRAASLRVSYTIKRCKCIQCGSRFQSTRINQSFCSESCRKHSAREYAKKRAAANDNIYRGPRQCAVCDVTFTTEYGDQRNKYCSLACSKKSNRARSARKAAKLRRRCAVVEIVDPIKVFDRDGWKCKLCSVKTSKKLRGTYEPNAPELDHIIPIAAGGEHSYRNTQCACRRCNGAKGATPLGQMLLFG